MLMLHAVRSNITIIIIFENNFSPNYTIPCIINFIIILQRLRSTMNSPTSLVVVGGGDDLVSFYLLVNNNTATTDGYC